MTTHSGTDRGALDALLIEERRFPPPPSFREHAVLEDPDVYRRAAENPEAYWAGWANRLSWFEPWKEVLRRLIRHHARDAGSRLGQITTEFIPGIDYGAGAKYSIFENSIACARWLRDTWSKAAGEAEQAGADPRRTASAT